MKRIPSSSLPLPVISAASSSKEYEYIHLFFNKQSIFDPHPENC